MSGRRLDNHCPDCGVGITDRSTYCGPCSKKGKKNPRYRHGLFRIKANPKRSITIEYAEWMKGVFKRDNWRCQHCNSNAKLRAHHIYSYAKYPELKLHVENGITLCEHHHRQLHQLFGHDVDPKQLKMVLR